MVIFSMLGTIMFCSKIIMEVLPNIHLLGMFTMVFTVAFRKKALIPIYVYVLQTDKHSDLTCDDTRVTVMAVAADSHRNSLIP